MGRRFIDERLDCGNHSTGGIVSRGTVSEGNDSVSVTDPGRVRSRWRGEEVGRDADNYEEGVLARGVRGPEELLDVVPCVERMTSGVH